MARSSRKTSADAGDARGEQGGAKRRGSPLTDYADASEPLARGGFAEAPQAPFEGAPLAGGVSDWAEQISREAEREGRSVEGHSTPDLRSDPPRRGEGEAACIAALLPLDGGGGPQGRWR